MILLMSAVVSSNNISIYLFSTTTEKLSNYCYILAAKRPEKSMNGMHVYGQTMVETSMYITVRRLLPVQ